MSTPEIETPSFEQRWEKFRLERKLDQEEFIASGYGFIDDLEDFVNLENKELRDALDKVTKEVVASVDNYQLLYSDKCEALEIRTKFKLDEVKS